MALDRKLDIMSNEGQSLSGQVQIKKELPVQPVIGVPENLLKKEKEDKKITRKETDTLLQWLLEPSAPLEQQEQLKQAQEYIRDFNNLLANAFIPGWVTKINISDAVIEFDAQNSGSNYQKITLTQWNEKFVYTYDATWPTAKLFLTVPPTEHESLVYEASIPLVEGNGEIKDYELFQKAKAYIGQAKA